MSAIENFENFCKVIYDDISSDSSRIVHKTMEFILKNFIQRREIEESERLLMQIKDMKYRPNDVFFNKMIDFASKNMQISLAQQLFEKYMLENQIPPSTVTYNTLLDIYFKNSRSDDAWKLFHKLKQEKNLKPDNFTYTTMINGIK